LCQHSQVEITAKVFNGYNAGKGYEGIDEDELKKTKGREYNYEGKIVGKTDIEVSSHEN